VLISKMKNLYQSGMSWLEIWVTFALKKTIEFLSLWSSQSWMGWIKQFRYSRFFIPQLTLKAQSSVACTF